MKQWYALYTKAKKEQQVHDLLAGRGLHMFLPLRRVLKKGHVVQTREPLFPCYLFAHVDLQEVGLSTLQWTEGLRSVVSFCGQPAVVDERVIQYIKRRLEEEVVPAEFLRFRPGERVTITDGPFKDMEAIFSGRLSAGGRVRVLLRILGQSTACEVDASLLRRAA